MRNTLAFAALLWLIGCSPAKQAVTYTPEQLTPTEKSVFWKITGNGLKKPSYLYGTIHLIPKKEYEMPVAVREALDHTKRVTFEIDMKELTSMSTQMGLMTKAFMPGNKTIKDLLSPEDYAFVKQKMKDRGLPGGMMERMKPMFLSTMLSSDDDGQQTFGNSAMTSVEMEVYKAARNRKLETAGLETTAYQMAIFDSIPYSAQAKMLVDGLRSTEADSTGGNQLEQMIKLYHVQDINAMQNMIEDEGEGLSDYEDILLKRRNTNWIPEMGKFMRDKPTLFAVGAGHLGGTGGVVALLRKAGYRVDAVHD